TGQVNSINWSRDGRSLVTASDDGTARVWDAQTGAMKVTVTMPASGQGAGASAGTQVTLAQFSPDGGSILTLGSDEVVRTWDVATGNAKVVLPARGSNPGALDATWGGDAQTVLTAGRDGRARVWALAAPGELTILPGDNLALV